MNSKILNLVLLALIGILVFQNFSPQSQSFQNSDQALEIKSTSSSYPVGKTIAVKIKNNTSKNYKLLFQCPKSPFQALRIQNGTSSLIPSQTKLNCQNSNIKNAYALVVKAQNEKILNLDYHSNQLFHELGSYKLQASYQLDGQRHNLESNEFEVEPAGFFRKTWINLFYRPIYNALIGIIALVPGNNLGFAIIVLTILIRLLLFHPNQKALSGQKKMQEIQPKLEAIRKKHKNNQQMMATETLKVWQSAKVNPFSSCLPMLIQFPILIAIFYVVQAGINPDKQILLYNFLSQIQIDQIQTQFLGLLDMTERNLYVLPVIVGILQYFQIKLTLPKSTAASPNSMQESMQKNMVYFMPALIAVFTASLPSGVGVYWATSTLFGIAQQLYINKKNN